MRRILLASVALASLTTGAIADTKWVAVAKDEAGTVYSVAKPRLFQDHSLSVWLHSVTRKKQTDTALMYFDCQGNFALMNEDGQTFASVPQPTAPGTVGDVIEGIVCLAGEKMREFH